MLYADLVHQITDLTIQIRILTNQFNEVLAENQILRTENQILRTENQILRTENQMIKSENQALKAEILELKEKLNTNSSNSSKPPSQDPFRKYKPKERSGRQQGAQPGHKGHARKLIPIEQVQVVHELKPDSCPNCGTSIFDINPIFTEVRQVVELPEMPPQVTQYNIHTCRCEGCGKHVKANIPNEAKLGLLINFNVKLLKEGIRRMKV